MQKYLWLAVTADKYELPIFVEDTAQKLASKLGITTGAVGSLVARDKNGEKSGRKIVKVKI